MARIAALASGALLAELETYPKPGLVSLVDNGSHDDMDAGTFRRSIGTLDPFFARLALVGAAGAPLADLRVIGLEAEAAMLMATRGVNTHRGAIFALGLLCAAAGAGALDLAAHVRDTWGEALANERPAADSHGGRAMRRFGVGGARGEAAAGFAAATTVGLPALREGRRLASKIPNAVSLPLEGRGQGSGLEKTRPAPDRRGRLMSPDDAACCPTLISNPFAQREGAAIEDAARVQAFFALLARLGDTNLLHRGDAAGLAFAQASAQTFLDAGGVGSLNWRDRAVTIHRAFVARRLSPGGSADLLAVTLFLDAVERDR